MEDTKAIVILSDAYELIRQAFFALNNPAMDSRENSIVLTKLEEAMMWCNKDRANKGFLPKTDTHVEIGMVEVAPVTTPVVNSSVDTIE